jgi:hypothetical protein
VKRHAELKKDVDCYFDEGWSPQFDRNLTNFAVYLWHKYCKREIEFDDFRGEFFLHVHDRMSRHLYDASKSNFKSYLFTLGRNVATKMVSFVKVRKYDEEFGYSGAAEDDEAFMQENIRSDQCLHSVENAVTVNVIDELQFEVFMQIVERRGLEVNEEELRKDLMYAIPSPLTEAYAYLAIRGVDGDMIDGAGRWDCLVSGRGRG